MSRILRLSLRSFCSSSVSNDPSSTSEPANGNTLNAIGRANLVGAGTCHGGTVVGQFGGTIDDLARLLVELVDTGEPAARHGLIGRGDHPHQAGLVVQRLEHRHGRHGGAVRVGDDALRRIRAASSPLTSATTSGTSGSMRNAEELSITIAPAAANLAANSRDDDAPGGEQGDVEAARVGGRRILDDDVGAVPRQRRPGRTGRREVAHLGDRKVAFGEQAPHHGADLACRSDDTDTDTVSCAVHGEKTNGTVAWAR